MPLPLNDERLDGLSVGCHVRVDSLNVALGHVYGVLPSVGGRHGEAADTVYAVFFGHGVKKSFVYLLLVPDDLNQRLWRDWTATNAWGSKFPFPIAPQGTL